MMILNVDGSFLSIHCYKLICVTIIQLDLGKETTFFMNYSG